MQLGCTKKLQDFLKENAQPARKDIDPFYTWSGALVTLCRRKAVIVVNDAAHCGFVLLGIKVANLKQIDALILDGIRQMLLCEKIAPTLVEKYLQECGEVHYTKTKNASAVARLNQYCKRVGYFEDDMVVGEMFQQAILQRVNHDYYQEDGNYKDTREELRRQFSEHYAVEQPCECTMAVVNVKIVDVPCFRQVRIPADTTLWQLHVVIQNALCWHDCHLHEFRTTDDLPLDIVYPEYAHLAMPGDFDQDTGPIEKVLTVQEAFRENPKLQYIYDFGDDWEHELELARFEEHSTDITPTCIMGSGDAPPEDVGGSYSFEKFLQVIKNPAAPEYTQMQHWATMQRWETFNREKVNARLRHM